MAPLRKRLVVLILSGGALLLTAILVSVYQSKRQPGLRLYFSPTLAASGRYEIDVSSDGYSYHCQVELPQAWLDCKGDRGWLVFKGRYLMGMALPGSPRRVKVRVLYRGQVLYDGALQPEGERVHELSLDGG